MLWLPQVGAGRRRHAGPGREPLSREAAAWLSCRGAAPSAWPASGPGRSSFLSFLPCGVAVPGQVSGTVKGMKNTSRASETRRPAPGLPWPWPEASCRPEGPSGPPVAPAIPVPQGGGSVPTDSHRHPTPPAAAYGFLSCPRHGMALPSPGDTWCEAASGPMPLSPRPSRWRRRVVSLGQSGLSSSWVTFSRVEVFIV